MATTMKAAVVRAFGKPLTIAQQLPGARRELQKKELEAWSFRFTRSNIETFRRELPHYETMTLGDYLAEKQFSKDFLNCYLIPMSSAVWSTPPERMLDFPAVVARSLR